MPILKLSNERDIPKIDLGRLVPGSLIQLLDVQKINGFEFDPGFYLWANPVPNGPPDWYLISVGRGARAYLINMDGDYPVINGIDHGVLNVQA